MVTDAPSYTWSRPAFSHDSVEGYPSGGINSCVWTRILLCGVTLPAADLPCKVNAALTHAATPDVLLVVTHPG